MGTHARDRAAWARAGQGQGGRALRREIGSKTRPCCFESAADGVRTDGKEERGKDERRAIFWRPPRNRRGVLTRGDDRSGRGILCVCSGLIVGTRLLISIH